MNARLHGGAGAEGGGLAVVGGGVEGFRKLGSEREKPQIAALGSSRELPHPHWPNPLILQVWKLRPRTLKGLSQGHPA